MLIGVAGSFGFSQIFGGKLSFSTQCQLQISGTYSLIYAELQSLDVLAALNEAFDAGLTGSLTVASAGFFTYSSGPDAPPVPLIQSFPGSPVPSSVARSATPVDQTTSFWMTLDLASGNQGLFTSLLDINVAQGTQLSLSATFAKGQQAGVAVKTAEYRANLDGSIRLFDLFEFEDVTVLYTAAASARVLVSGTLGACLFENTYCFSGSLLSDSGNQSVIADLAPQDKTVLPSLFGGSFPNISFTDIHFNLFYPYGQNTAKAQFMVRGGCSFGGLAFTGLLYLEAAKPVLASVVFTQSASIKTLFDQCLSGASWPENLIDLTLDAGSQIYYYDGAAPLRLPLSNDGHGPTILPVPGPSSSPNPPVLTTYVPGFNASAAFTLDLLDSISVSGNLTVNKDGVTAAIALADPIDIYVMQFTRQGDASKGPTLAISTRGDQGSMSFSAGVQFFEKSFGADVTITLTRGSDGGLVVDAQLQPAKDYAPFFTTSDQIGFRYSRLDGFQISNWNSFPIIKDLVDFFSKMKEIANAGSGCGQIADFVCKDLLQQNYDVSPSFNTTANGLELSLSITCTLTFLGSTSTAQLPAFTIPNAVAIPLPATISLDNLLEVIENGISGAAESIVNALLENGNAVATFLVLFGGQQAINYASSLICRGLVNSGVSGATSAGVGAAGDALGSAAVAAALVASAVAGSNGGNGGGNGGGGQQTAPAAPGDVAVIIQGTTTPDIRATWQLRSGAQTYVARLMGPEGQIATSGQLSYSESSFDFGAVQRPATLPADGQVSVTASNPVGSSPPGTAAIRFLAAPTGLSAQSTSATPPDAALAVAWTGSPDAISYTLACTGKPPIDSATPSATLTFDPTDPAGSYSLSVIASGAAHSVSSPASAPLVVTRLSAPARLEAVSTSAAIVASWDAVPQASEYRLAWTDPRNSTGAVSVPASADPILRATIPLPSPVVAGKWTITVQAFPADDGKQLVGGPPSPPCIVAVSPASTPQQLAAACFAGGISGTDCGMQLLAAFPNLTPNELAVAMAQAGYAASATADGLRAFHEITPEELAKALAYAYPATPLDLARSRFAAGVSGADCGLQLVAAFSDLTPSELAVAMAQAGYAASATADGLRAFHAITPEELAKALAYAYPATPLDLARSRFAAGVGGTDCGDQLIAGFPDLTPNQLAAAMAQAGYAASATGDGLRGAFPAITPSAFAIALSAAYSASPTGS